MESNKKSKKLQKTTNISRNLFQIISQKNLRKKTMTNLQKILEKFKQKSTNISRKNKDKSTKNFRKKKQKKKKKKSTNIY